MRRLGKHTKEVINWLMESKSITQSFINKWHNWLEKAIENPDTLWANAPKKLLNELTERNLIIYPLSTETQQLGTINRHQERTWRLASGTEAIRRTLENVGR